MEEINQYKLLFEDSFTSSLVFIFSKQYVFDVMGIVGIRTNIVYLVYFCASFLAINVNYLLGFLIAKFIKSFNNYSRFVKFKAHYNKYLFSLSILSFVDLWGGLIALVSGVTKSNYLYFLCLSFFGLLCRVYYLSLS